MCRPTSPPASIGQRTACPERWRDQQQIEHSLGKYIISDKPMSEEEWARERADVIDAEAAVLLVNKPKY
jgi:hypothetical protein